jgi:hypothetical protein
MTRAIVAGLLAALASACDPAGLISEPPSATCARVGAKCQLADGPLGVCESAPCTADAAPPCLVCTAQH